MPSTTVHVPEDIWRRFKALCPDANVSRICRAAIEAELAREEERRRAEVVRCERLPVCTVTATVPR